MNFFECQKILLQRKKENQETTLGTCPCDSAHEEDYQKASASSSSSTSFDISKSIKDNDRPIQKEGVTISMTPKTILKDLFALQEERVHIYTDFEKGFHQYCATPKFEEFSKKITEQFSSVSRRLNHLEDLLRDESNNTKAVALLVRQLQEQEKEKLLMTSALLVEKMRLQKCVSTCDDETTTEMRLYKESIDSLTKKRQDIVGKIIEIMEDLRCEALELEENIPA